jgi:DNA polymerase elongation subunit (family B)
MTELTNNSDLIFNVIDWYEVDEVDIDDDSSESEKSIKYNNNDKKYVIKVFGRTENNKSVYLKIENFPPHFYILLPESWTNNLDMRCDTLINELKKRNYNLDKTLLKYEIVYRKKFYGFCAEKKFCFLRLVFKNKSSMFNTVRLFDYKISIRKVFYKFEIYESNIDPYIRFIHIQNLSSCGWLIVDKKDLNKCNESTTCDYSYSVEWYNVKSYKNDKIAPFKICSFDIECNSADGSFPQANRIDDKIIQIGITFTIYGSSEIVKQVMISLNTCDIINNTEVIECTEEVDLLLKFREIIQREDPDILTGYNIFGFDYIYIMDRATYLNKLHNESPLKYKKLSDNFYFMSKLEDYRCKLVSKNISSSALGDNKINYVDTIGRVNIDLMKVVQRDYKLNSYKLDSVAENFFKDKVIDIEKLENNEYKIKSNNIQILKQNNYIRFEKDDEVIMQKYKIQYIDYNNKFLIIKNIDKLLLEKCKLTWGIVKDDIKPKDIFELYKKTSSDRKIIAEYCIQDCALVSRLIAKLEIITNNMSMASVCHVPLHYIFFRGQGIKSLSLVAKYCRSEGYLIPVMKKIINNNVEEVQNTGYEGATVFEPEIGFHRKPVPVLDYNSLYPSSIISCNVSHETLVTQSEYDNLPNYKYYDVSYNNHDGSQTHCRYAKKIDEDLETNPSKSKFGIIPSILMKLLTERKLAKKEMALVQDAFLKTIYDGKQNALKVTANSIYGQLGAPTSPIYFKHGAASTTAIGREMLNKAKDFVENNLTDILYNLYKADEEEYERLLQIHLKERDAKFELEFKEFIKELFDNYQIKPKVVYGDSIMPYTPVLIKINYHTTILSVEELGIILNSIGKMWEDYELFKENDNKISNRYAKERIILTDLNIMAYTNNGWSPLKQLIRHKCNKAIYRILTHIGLVDVTEDHSLILETGKYIKPNELNINSILMHNFPLDNLEIMNLIVDDSFYRDIHNALLEKHNFIDVDKQILAQHLYYLLKSLGYNVSINSNNNNYRLSYTTSKFYNNPKQIKKIEKLYESNTYYGYVYDLTTDEGVFQAGIGELIVKNTDSIFIKMDMKLKSTNEDIYDKETLKYNIELGKCTSRFFKTLLQYPHNMEYEKTFYPFAIMAKKKYIGNKYEEDHNHYKQTSIGVVLKRRDNANVVKKIVGGMVNIMMDDIDINKAIRFIKKATNDLLRGKFEIHDFITSKTIKGYYKGKKLTTDSTGNKGDVGTWKWDDVECSQNHVCLARRIKERDPGNAPQLNDRIPFVTIVVPEKKKVKILQGEKIEHPEYILEKKLKIDYLFYLTNQIMNPSKQFLELIMKPAEAEKLFRDFIVEEEDKRIGRQSLLKFGISIKKDNLFDFDSLIDITSKPNKI